MTGKLTDIELMRLQLAAEAVAAAAKDELDKRSRAAAERGERATSAALEGDVTSSPSFSQDRLNITDPAAFYGYLRELYPQNFQERTVVTLEPINANWIKKWLEGALADVQHGELGTDDLPPGLVFAKGGDYLHTSIKPRKGLKDELLAIARRQLDAGTTPGLIHTYVPPALESAGA